MGLWNTKPGEGGRMHSAPTPESAGFTKPQQAGPRVMPEDLAFALRETCCHLLSPEQGLVSDHWPQNICSVLLGSISPGRLRRGWRCGHLEASRPAPPALPERSAPTRSLTSHRASSRARAGGAGIGRDSRGERLPPSHLYHVRLGRVSGGRY